MSEFGSLVVGNLFSELETASSKCLRDKKMSAFVQNCALDVNMWSFVSLSMRSQNHKVCPICDFCDSDGCSW